MRNTYDNVIREVMNSTSSAPPDMSAVYNTQLDPSQEAAFQQTPFARDVYDYDARGEFLAGQDRNNPTGHGQDTFKKPNHPTFSTGSQYNGTDAYQGGQWLDNSDGTTVFVPGSDNTYTLDALQRYMKEREPYSRLMPQRRQP